MPIQKQKQKYYILFLCLFLILSFFAALSFGSIAIPFDHISSILLHSIGIPVNQTWDAAEEVIILQLRLPRAIMAILIGIMLSIAGVASQNIFKNPVADPYIIGISSAAGCGAAIGIILELAFFQKFTLPFLAFICSIFSVLIIIQIAMKQKRLSIYTLLLSGIALSYIFSSLISFILFSSENKSHIILNILLGHLWGVGWDEVLISFLVLVICSVPLYFYGLDMNLLLFGDQSAQTMGVNIKQSRLIILVCMTLLTATAVAFCGTIGFVGIIVPHITRILFGSDHRKIIPLSGVIGSILLLWADLIARTIAPPLEIPVGVFTSLMGGPFFIYLVIKYRKSSSE